jgi:hypothetical protein
VVAVTVTCPDCPATASGEKQLTHAKTCPLGLGLDERTAADREWFEAHPWATEYRRPLHWTERAELVMLALLPDVPGEPIGRVLVRQLALGVRTRSFGDVAILLTTGAGR